MNKIVDYIVVSEWELDTLQKAVKKHLEEGFQPYGSFVVDDIFHQPMVKFEENDKSR